MGKYNCLVEREEAVVVRDSFGVVQFKDGFKKVNYGFGGGGGRLVINYHVLKWGELRGEF